jgi:hypothetical protein
VICGACTREEIILVEIGPELGRVSERHRGSSTFNRLAEARTMGAYRPKATAGNIHPETPVTMPVPIYAAETGSVEDTKSRR